MLTFQPTLSFISCRHRRLQLVKATVLAESSTYFVYSPGSLCSSGVHKHESYRCHTLPLFLTFFLSFHFSMFSFYINIVNSILFKIPGNLNYENKNKKRSAHTDEQGGAFQKGCRCTVNETF